MKDFNSLVGMEIENAVIELKANDVNFVNNPEVIRITTASGTLHAWKKDGKISDVVKPSRSWM